MTMFCDCGNPEAHRGEHIPKPVTDTPPDLDAIEARALAATDGPWTAHEFGSYSDHEPTSIVVMQGDGPDWWQSADDGDYIARLGWDRQEWDDAEFIAHARTDVPALVAALRKAETAHAALIADLRALCDDSDHGWVHRRAVLARLDRHAPTTGATP